MSLPAILMIHGMWSRASTFTTLRQELDVAGIRSAAVTLPFHDAPLGASAPQGLGDVRLVDYVDAVVRTAATLDGPLVLLGHSMGGLLAQQAAVRLQPRGLILLSSAPSAQASRMGAAFSVDALKTLAGITGKWGWWKKPSLLSEKAARHGVFNGVPETELRSALTDLTWDSGRVLAQIAAPWLDSQKDTLVDYNRLTMPSLVLTGLDDHIVPPAVSRQTARLLTEAGARVDYEEWPNVGHWLFHNAVRPRTASAIARFMASLV